MSPWLSLFLKLKKEASKMIILLNTYVLTVTAASLSLPLSIKVLKLLRNRNLFYCPSSRLAASRVRTRRRAPPGVTTKSQPAKEQERSLVDRRLAIPAVEHSRLPKASLCYNYQPKNRLSLSFFTRDNFQPAANRSSKKVQCTGCVAIRWKLGVGS